MQYVLFTENGRVFRFYVEGIAQMYQRAYGGKIVKQERIVCVEQAA